MTKVASDYMVQRIQLLASLLITTEFTQSLITKNIELGGPLHFSAVWTELGKKQDSFQVWKLNGNILRERQWGFYWFHDSMIICIPNQSAHWPMLGHIQQYGPITSDKFLGTDYLIDFFVFPGPQEVAGQSEDFFRCDGNQRDGSAVAWTACTTRGWWKVAAGCRETCDYSPHLSLVNILMIPALLAQIGPTLFISTPQ